MKNLVYILLIFCFVLSCSKDKNELSGVEMIASQFPESYRNSESVYFINADGDIKQFHTKYEVKEYTNIVDGVEKETRLFSTIMAEDGAASPLVLLSASNIEGIDNFENYSLRLRMNYYNIGIENTIRLNLPIRDGQLQQLIINEFDSRLEFEITGIEYFDVHSAIEEDEESYSVVYYNAEFGMIGFRDHLNDLWVLVEG